MSEFSFPRFHLSRSAVAATAGSFAAQSAPTLLQVGNIFGFESPSYRDADFLPVFATCPIGMPTKVSGEHEFVSIARDLYLGAFAESTLTKPSAYLERSFDEDGPYWRLTFYVPADWINDVVKLVSIETRIHEIVRAKSANLAGFFALDYVTEDDRAGRDL